MYIHLDFNNLVNRSTLRKELIVNSFHFFVFGYLITSVSLVLLLLRIQSKNSMMTVIVFLLFGPILIAVALFLNLLYPPSGGDAALLVYGKLSTFEGKSVWQIHKEILTAGQTIGWGGLGRVKSTLELLTKAGCARREERAAADLITKIAHGLEKKLEGSPAEIQAVLGELNKVAEQMRDLESEPAFASEPLLSPIYFKGCFPGKRSRLKSALSWRWGIRPA